MSLQYCLHFFSTMRGEDPSIFSISSNEFSTLEIIPRPNGYVNYDDFLRKNNFVLSNSPVNGECYILTAWDTYHLWEDGRYLCPHERSFLYPIKDFISRLSVCLRIVPNICL